jgi:hypothetical protein
VAFQNITQIREANDRIGQFWFSQQAMRWFNTRIESAVYVTNDMSYFLTSEHDDHGQAWFGERRYSIRQCDAQGIVDTVGEFGAYFTLDEARMAVWDIIRNKEKVETNAEHGNNG